MSAHVWTPRGLKTVAATTKIRAYMCDDEIKAVLRAAGKSEDYIKSYLDGWRKPKP